jgi:hypothetical protein
MPTQDTRGHSLQGEPVHSAANYFSVTANGELGQSVPVGAKAVPTSDGMACIHRGAKSTSMA